MENSLMFFRARFGSCFMTVVWMALIGCTAQHHQGNDPNFVFVKGGSFVMGNTFDNETEGSLYPVERVQVDDFLISRYEVTREEWEEVMGYDPCTRSPFVQDSIENLPVHHVSWIEVVQFCNQKSIREGLAACYTIDEQNVICDFTDNGYRLPTEAEWEYAARGGKKSRHTRFSGSSTADEVAWCGLDCLVDERTQPVGTKRPNELGLYDMSGNVWEWCWDWYDEESGEKGATNKENVLQRRILRIIRAGCWFDRPELCTVYKWGVRLQRHTRDYNAIGFRLARSVE